MLGMIVAAVGFWTAPSPPPASLTTRVQEMVPRLLTHSDQRREVERDLLALGPQAVEPLIEIAKDSAGPPREAIRELLPQYGPSSIERLYWAPRRSPVNQDAAKAEAVDAVAHMGEAALPEIRRFIDSGQESPRVFAISVLRRMGPLATFEVTSLLKHRSEEVRRSAAALLVTLADPRSAAALRQALSSDDPSIRMYAAQGLGAFRDQHAVEGLLLQLNDPHETPRAAAAGALGRMYEPRFRLPLARLARSDSEGMVRAAAARTLIEIHDPAAQRLGHRYLPFNTSPAFEYVGYLRERLWLVVTALITCFALWVPIKMQADPAATRWPVTAWLAVAFVGLLGLLWGRAFTGMSEALERMLLMFCVPATTVMMLLAGPTILWTLVPIGGIVLGIGVALVGSMAGMLGWVYGTMAAPKIVAAFFLAAPIAAWWNGRRVNPSRKRSFRYLALLGTAAFYAGYGLGWWALWRP